MAAQPETASAAFGGGMPLGSLTLTRFSAATWSEFEDWVRNDILVHARRALADCGLDREAQARICAEACARPLSTWDLYDWAVSRRGFGKTLRLGLAPRHANIADGDIPPVRPRNVKRIVEWLFGLDIFDPKPGEAKPEDKAEGGSPDPTAPST